MFVKYGIALVLGRDYFSHPVSKDMKLQSEVSI